MMNRRQFAVALAGFAAAVPGRSAAAAHYFLLETFDLRQGDQIPRLNNCLKTWVASISKTHPGPKLVLEAVIAPHTPRLAVIVGVGNFEDVRTAQTTLTDALHTLGGDEPAFDALNIAVLEAAAYSPEISAAKHATPRYFELRTYHSPTLTQLDALHRRFARTEMGVFHRSGIFPLFSTSTLIGPNAPNLTYLIPFDSLAAREKAWAAFAADPEWIKARQESIDQSGQIVSVSDIAIYRATPYSPIS